MAFCKTALTCQCIDEADAFRHNTLIHKAVEESYISEEDVQSLKEWRKDQQAWSDMWNQPQDGFTVAQFG